MAKLACAQTNLGQVSAFSGQSKDFTFGQGEKRAFL